MPLPLQLDIGSLPVVASGAKPQMILPRYGRIFALDLNCKVAGGGPATDAQIANDIVLIRVIADGQEIHSISAQDLMIYHNRQQGVYSATDGGNMFVPHGVQTGVLPIPFADLTRGSYVEQTATSLATKNIQNLTLEVTFSAGAITITTVDVSMFYDLVQANLSQYLSFTTFPFALVAGINEIQQLPREPDVGVLQYMIVNTNQGGVTLDRMEMIFNSQSILQLPRKVALQKEVRMSRNPQSPTATGSGAPFTQLEANFLDFNPTGDISTFLPLKGTDDQRLRLTYTGAPGLVGVIRASIRGLSIK